MANVYGESEIKALLSEISKIKVTVIGDICLDVYWPADMRLSSLSRETPHYPLPVVGERMSAGAGGNVAVNIAALKPEKLNVIGVTGTDWRGVCLKNVLCENGISDEYTVTAKNRITNAYCKPMRFGYSGIEFEDPRLDFESREPIDDETEAKLIENLKKCAADTDILCVSDQFEYGSVTPRVREEIIKLAKSGLKVVVDSRSNIGEYRNVILKPNEIECSRALYENSDSLSGDGVKTTEMIAAAELLAKKLDSEVILTVGSRGVAYYGNGKSGFQKAFDAKGPVDIVGAGDCFLSAFSCAFAASGDFDKACFTANLAACVSVRKLNTTGSASREEILARLNEG